MRALYFYAVIFGFFAGIFAAHSFVVSIFEFAMILIISIAIFFFLLLYAQIRKKNLAHPIFIIAVFLLAFSLGGMRMDAKQTLFEDNPLKSSLNQNVILSGVVEDDVSVTDTSAIIKIDSQKILLKYPNADMKYGDRVEVSGLLSRPENFETDQGKEFDYISYLKKDSIQYLIKNPKIEKQENGEASIFSLLHSIKMWFIGNIESVVPEPESALAAGVTIAGKGALSKEIKEDFIRAGVIHIVVLSGYNIAIVIAMIMAMCGFLGRRWASAIAITAVSLFVILSGGAAPVIRAAIMASIVIIGTLSYAPVLQNRALFGAAFFMTIWNPILLTSDASFALSFLATFAIVNVVKIIEPMLSFVGDRFQIKKILSETLATQIFVLPYLLYQIGRLSIIAPISNLVILPFIPAIMLLCFIVGLLAFIPFISLPIAGLLTLLAWLVIEFAHIFAYLPFASFDISISLWTMIVIYILYFSFGIFLNKKSQKN